MQKLQKNISYQFKDINLLKQALTHRSVSKKNNERLEFLGDSVLGCVISLEIYQRFSLIDEGQLSRLRSSLVRGQTLAKLAKILNLSQSLLLGQGELKSGGFRRESIQADAFEAILGAIFLDSDYSTVSEIILKLYNDLLNESGPEDSLKDFKTQLQELLQKKDTLYLSMNSLKLRVKIIMRFFMSTASLRNLALLLKKVQKASKEQSRPAPSQF